VAATLTRSVGSVLIAIATIVTIVAVAVVVFLNPVWVGFEQARTGADRFTGYSIDQVHTVTGQILSDLIIGPPTFDMTVNGQPVFDSRERQHMIDVRGVFTEVLVVVLISVLVLVLAGWRARPRSWLWRSIAGGAGVLIGAVAVLSVFFGLFFDTAFDVFHRIFFQPGSYDFDPATEKLVQLFPDDFWFETSLALAVVLLAIGIGVLIVSLRRIGPPERTAQPVPSLTPEPRG
jgi:integral membrane protein (TIGR01906 family)